MHIAIDANLAGEPELSQDAILFKAGLFLFPEGWLLAEELDTAGCAAGESSASVTDIDPGLFNGEGQLFALLRLKWGKTFNLDRVGHGSLSYTPFSMKSAKVEA